MAKKINRSKEQQRKRDKLLDKSYTYLSDNFHKFLTFNKIKIALELVKKDIGDKVKHSGSMMFEGDLLAAHTKKFGEHAKAVDGGLAGTMP